jgi:hypothetical protein
MNKDAAEILIILLNAMKTAFIILFQETQDGFLELAAALARDDLDRLGTLFNRLVHNVMQRGIKRITIGENTVQVKF